MRIFFLGLSSNLLHLRSPMLQLPSEQGGQAPRFGNLGCFVLGSFISRTKHSKKTHAVLEKLKANLRYFLLILFICSNCHLYVKVLFKVLEGLNLLACFILHPFFSWVLLSPHLLILVTVSSVFLFDLQGCVKNQHIFVGAPFC